MSQSESELQKILDTIHDAQLDLVSFLELVFSAKSPRIRQSIGYFFKKNGFRRVFDAMLLYMDFSPGKRNSLTTTVSLREVLGKGIWQLVQQVLVLEVKSYCKDPETRRPVSDMGPKVAAEFNFDTLHTKLAVHCPRLLDIITGLCCGEDDEAKNKRKRKPRKRARTDNVESDDALEESSGEERPGIKMSKKRKCGVKRRRKQRNKSLTVVMAICSIIFTRSKTANMMQTPLGYYLLATGVPKDVINFMNRAGLSVAYSTIIESLKVMGESNLKACRAKIAKVS